MDGNQVPQDLVTKVGETFESILKEVCSLSLSFPLSPRNFIYMNSEFWNIYFSLHGKEFYMSLNRVVLWTFSDES